MTSLEDNSDYKKKELKKTLAGLEKERYNFFIFFLPPLVLAAARNMNRRVNVVSPMSKQIRNVRIEQIRDVRFLFFCAGGGAGFYPQIHSPFFEGSLQSPLLWGLWSCG